MDHILQSTVSICCIITSKHQPNCIVRYSSPYITNPHSLYILQLSIGWQMIYHNIYCSLLKYVSRIDVPKPHFSRTIEFNAVQWIQCQVDFPAVLKDFWRRPVCVPFDSLTALLLSFSPTVKYALHREKVGKNSTLQCVKYSWQYLKRVQKGPSLSVQP